MNQPTASLRLAMVPAVISALMWSATCEEKGVGVEGSAAEEAQRWPDCPSCSGAQME